MANNAAANTDTPSAFVSKLAEGRERFLAHVIEHGLEIGRRTPEDFIRHFPPTAIMNGLEHQAGLRAQILVLTTGVKQKIALKKSAQSAGDDLQIALEEGETDADSIVALFDPDDRVRYLDAKKLWSYVVEGEFWTATISKRDDFERAKRHIAFMLDRAIADQLVTHRDIIDGISVSELATRLPKDKLGAIIQQALSHSRKNELFTDEDLLKVMPPHAMVDHVPLDHVWGNVIVPKIAQAHGYVEDAGETVKDALDWLDSDRDDSKPDQPSGMPGARQPSKSPQASVPGTDSADASEKDEVEVTADDIKIS